MSTEAEIIARIAAIEAQHAKMVEMVEEIRKIVVRDHKKALKEKRESDPAKPKRKAGEGVKRWNHFVDFTKAQLAESDPTITRKKAMAVASERKDDAEFKARYEAWAALHPIPTDDEASSASEQESSAAVEKPTGMPEGAPKKRGRPAMTAEEKAAKKAAKATATATATAAASAPAPAPAPAPAAKPKKITKKAAAAKKVVGMPAEDEELEEFSVGGLQYGRYSTGHSYRVEADGSFTYVGVYDETTKVFDADYPDPTA
jgi:hypothetical protein